MNKPIILYEGKNTPRDLDKLRESQEVWRQRDVYELQLRELFEIQNPHILGTPQQEEKLSLFLKERVAGQEHELRGNWIYFPWSGVLLHTVSKDDYHSLMTNRNRDIITPEEQAKLRNFCVGMVGLSVGSNVATTLAYSGTADTMKLCEFDDLETTNLNRIRARIDQIGIPKIDIVAQQVYEANPYANITCFRKGLNTESLEEFVLGEPKPNIIFEIMDSFEIKIHLRALAREHGIPVVMVTNLGDRVLMDLERYDMGRDVEFFNGRAGEIPGRILEHPDVSDEDKHDYAVKLAGGLANVPKRAVDSVNNIGKTLVGRPQLATSVTISGAFCSYFTKKLALEKDIPSASWLVDLDKLFTAENPFVISSPDMTRSPQKTAEEKLFESLDVPGEIGTEFILGHHIRYMVCGKGAPLLLLHGGTFGWGVWYKNIPHLAKHFTVYAIDMPGTGRSSKIDYENMDFERDFVDVVAAFIKAKKLEGVSALGHSFGGWVALKTALRKEAGVKKLILVDAVGFSDHAAPPEIVMSMAPVAGFVSKTVLKPKRNNATLEKFLRSAFYKKDALLSEKFLDYFYETMGLSHNLSFISRLISLRKKLKFGEEIAHISKPTLIVWGEGDSITPLKYSEQRFKEIKNAKVEIVSNSGHAPFLEHDEKFNEMITEFL